MGAFVAFKSPGNSPTATLNFAVPLSRTDNNLEKAAAAESLNDDPPVLDDDEVFAVARVELAKQHFGPLWRRYLDIDVRFDESYDRAMQGDASAVLKLLDVLSDCMLVQGLERPSQIPKVFESVASSPITEAMQEAMVFLFDDCRQVWLQFPDGGTQYWVQRKELIDGAVKDGNATARLIQLGMSGLGETDLPEIDALLNQALRSQDHQAFERARDLFNYFPHDEQSLQVYFWNHAACKRDVYCDLEMYQALETDLFTHEIATINTAIIRLEQRLEDPRPIPFQKMFAAPLQMTDGAMWFESLD